MTETKTKKTTPGHGRRVRIAKGGSPVHIRCACGWTSEEFPDRAGAEAAHDDHLQTVPADESGEPATGPTKAGGRKPRAKKAATAQSSKKQAVDNAAEAKAKPGKAGATAPKPKVAPPRGPKSPPKGDVEPVVGHKPELVENPSFLPWHVRCECGWNSTLLKTREEVEVEHAQHLVDMRDE